MSTVAPATSITCTNLADLVNQWEKHAGKFFILAEREKDPLGQKFYQSTAMAYANCANDLRQMLAQTFFASHNPQVASSARRRS
jgi:hypothetical protein